MTVDEKTGHIWVGNNGQDLWEQVYLVQKGDNYGWSVMEGSHPFYPNRKAGPTPFVKPTRRASALRGPLADRRHRLLRHEVSRAAGRLHLRRLLDRQDLGRPPRRHASHSGTRNWPTRACRSPASAPTRTAKS